MWGVYGRWTVFADISLGEIGFGEKAKVGESEVYRHRHRHWRASEREGMEVEVGRVRVGRK